MDGQTSEGNLSGPVPKFAVPLSSVFMLTPSNSGCPLVVPRNHADQICRTGILVLQQDHESKYLE
jgi:hypothetical protein